jgi:hypothetical protein
VPHEPLAPIAVVVVSVGGLGARVDAHTKQPLTWAFGG